MKRSPITPLSLLLATLAAGGVQAADLTTVANAAWPLADGELVFEDPGEVAWCNSQRPLSAQSGSHQLRP